MDNLSLFISIYVPQKQRIFVLLTTKVLVYKRVSARVGTHWIFIEAISFK